MRVSTKIIIWSWVLLILVISSLIYSAYSKLNPDSLVQLLNTQVKENYPGSTLAIGKVDYGFSLDFDLTLHQLSLSRDEKILAVAKEVQLKVPWWLILLDRGNAQINISDLDIYVQSTDIENSPTEITKRISDKPFLLEVKLPKYLVDAHYTLRAKNISIKELNSDRRFFSLTKLLVREFQYGKNSAFEINIPIDISHKNKRFSSDLWLFGDVTPNVETWTLHYRGEFKTKETIDGYQFDDLVIDGQSSFRPLALDVTSQIDLFVERKKVGEGKVIAKHDELSFDVKFEKLPLNYLNLIGDEIKNPFWRNTQGVAEGKIKFVRSLSGEKTATLSSKLSFNGDFTFETGLEIPGKWALNFQNDKWETTFISPKGEVNFFRRAVIDFDKAQMSQYSQEIGLSQIDMKTVLSAVSPLSFFLSTDKNPYQSAVLSIKNCSDGDQVFNGAFRYGITPFETFYHSELNSNLTHLNLSYFRKSGLNQLKMNVGKFNWPAHYRFLSPYLNLQEGIIDGEINGQWTDDWQDGKWLINMTAKNLNGPSGSFFEFDQKSWDVFSLDSSKASERTWNMSIDKHLIKMNTLKLENEELIQISGKVSTLPQVKTQLSLSYPKNKKIKVIKKEVSDLFLVKEAP